MSKRFSLSLLIFLLSATFSYGFETKGQDCTKCHSLTTEEARELIKPMAADVKVLEIRVSPSSALWEVFSETGGRKTMLYVDFSKKYLFSGTLYSLKERRNLTQESFNALNKIDGAQIPLDDALVMGDPKAKIRIIAFDDPD
jgi:thiol:disulfide interchange protein DsbC